MKRNDWILIIVIFVIALVSYIVFHMFNSSNEETEVVITVDGEIYATLSLEEDQEFTINEHNYIVIEDGVVNMIEADCPDELCVHQNPIDENGESIICLPNKVIVSIVSSSDNQVESEYDITTN